MPEGDTVYLAGKRLHAALAGSVIDTCDFRTPALALECVAGQSVKEVVSYGKHLLTRFDDGRTLHTHFRMDGSWHLYATGDRWRGGPLHQVRVILRTPTWTAVGYRLHDLALAPTQREADWIGHLGPDILGANWSIEESIIRMRSRPDMTVATSLVDQRNVAGIGNIYRTEALFLSGVDPRVRVKDLDEEHLRDCLQRAHALMMRNRDRSSQSTTGDERRAHHVYGRARRPCRRCGTRIRALRAEELPREYGRANEQTVAYCPTCQSGPTA